LGLQGLQALSEAADAGFGFGLVDGAFGIRVDQPADALADPGDLRLNADLPGLARHRLQGLQTTRILLGQTPGVLQQATHRLPNRQVEPVGANLGILAQPLATEAVGVAADTTVVRVIAPVPLAGTGTDRLAIISVATTGTDEESLQEITVAA